MTEQQYHEIQQRLTVIQIGIWVIVGMVGLIFGTVLVR